MSKYAWKPIMKSLRDRSEKIQNSIDAAENARLEIDNLKEENKKIMDQARAERDNLLQEAKEIKDKMIRTAEQEAKEKANKVIEDARLQMDSEKNKTLSEIKATVADLTVDIAEKVLRKELDDKQKQKDYINNLVKDVKFN
ncbi:MAG: F0F1 ATP synthase subunit B [Bacteroidota bacterium]|nr:F0F1 ATP synthase subunit B [Bacteroidota bacterium]